MRNILIVKILFFLIVVSCKNEEKKDIYPKRDFIDKKNENYTKKNILEYSIFFYDTVYRNKSYEGYIKYKSNFDTINSKQGDRRFTLYYAKSTSKLTSEYSEIKMQTLDTFGSKNNNEIPIKFNFKNLGKNYVDGFIEDQILVPTKDSTKVRVITQDARITFKVFVIDSTLKSNPIKEPFSISEIKPNHL